MLVIEKEKKIWTGKRQCRVTLENDGFMYSVKVDGEVFKKTVNELFALQTFNAI